MFSIICVYCPFKKRISPVRAQCRVGWYFLSYSISSGRFFLLYRKTDTKAWA